MMGMCIARSPQGEDGYRRARCVIMRNAYTYWCCAKAHDCQPLQGNAKTTNTTHPAQFETGFFCTNAHASRCNMRKRTFSSVCVSTFVKQVLRLHLPYLFLRHCVSWLLSLSLRELWLRSTYINQLCLYAPVYVVVLCACPSHRQPKRTASLLLWLYRRR